MALWFLDVDRKANAKTALLLQTEKTFDKNMEGTFCTRNRPKAENMTSMMTLVRSFQLIKQNLEVKYD